jgi:putative ABC transport system permease protein
MIPSVKEVVPSITFSGTLAGGEKSGIVMIQATDPGKSTSLLGFRSIIDGRDLIGDDTAKVVLAKGVARKLGARVGDVLTLMSVTKGGGTNAADVEVVGIASIGLRELENIMIYMPLRMADQFLMIKSVPLLILVLEKTEYTDETAAFIQQKIMSKLSSKIVIKKWNTIADYYTQVDGFYQQLLLIIRLIIVLVVVFTIVNTMIMAVFERTREIGTLRALGSTKGRIMVMFILEGIWIGLIGGVLGVGAGIGIAALINTVFGGVYIPPPPGMAEGYQALFQPDASSIWRNILLSFSVAAIASIYPATKAVKLKIADALRYT